MEKYCPAFLFNKNFITFDPQIGATDLLVRPSFDCQNRLSKLGRHTRQPATVAFHKTNQKSLKIIEGPSNFCGSLKRINSRVIGETFLG